MAALPPDSPVSPGEPAAPANAEFVQLFTRHQRRLYLYILSLLPNPVDAEEVLQEANLVIWAKFSEFKSGSNFLAWACQIAYYEVLKAREKKRRDKLQFNPELLELLAEEGVAQSDLLERRRLALVYCLGKLRDRDRELIQSRYSPGENGQSVAASLKRPANSIYQSLSRIRRTLLECVNRRLATEGQS